MITRNINDDNTLAYLFRKVKDELTSVINKAVESLTNAINGKVSKSGDTMTGTLLITSSLVLKHSTARQDQTPSTQVERDIIIRDSQNETVGGIFNVFRTTGAIDTIVQSRRIISGTSISNSLTLKLDSAGKRIVEVSATAPWRLALQVPVITGLAGYANGNTHGSISTGQYVYVMNHSTLSEGMYIAKSAISANAALSTSNLTACSAGGLNYLNNKVIITGDQEKTISSGYVTISYPSGCSASSHTYFLIPIYSSSYILGWSAVMQPQSSNINAYIRQGTTVPANNSKIGFRMVCIRLI